MSTTQTKLSGLLRRPGYRYLVIGGSVYVLELIIIWVALRMGASSLWAVGISFWAGLGTSFLLQKLVTFRDRRMHHRVLIPQVAAFSLLVLFNFGFTLLIVKLLANVLPAAAARTLALAITTTWNFYLYKTRIFRIGV